MRKLFSHLGISCVLPRHGYAMALGLTITGLIGTSVMSTTATAAVPATYVGRYHAQHTPPNKQLLYDAGTAGYKNRDWSDSQFYGSYHQEKLKQPEHEQTHSRISANIYYQAPTTTIIQRNVQIIPPQSGVGDVYYSQDSYVINPPEYVYPHSGAYRNHRSTIRYVPAIVDEKSTERRAKQWTDKSDFE